MNEGCQKEANSFKNIIQPPPAPPKEGSKTKRKTYNIQNAIKNIKFKQTRMSELLYSRIDILVCLKSTWYNTNLL